MNRFAIMRRDGFSCRYCGAKASDGVRLHVDHVQPRSKGGADHHLNLVTACSRCNISKGASEPEWEACSPIVDINGYPWHGPNEDIDLFCSNSTEVEIIRAVAESHRCNLGITRLERCLDDLASS